MCGGKSGGELEACERDGVSNQRRLRAYSLNNFLADIRYCLTFIRSTAAAGGILAAAHARALDRPHPLPAADQEHGTDDLQIGRERKWSANGGAANQRVWQARQYLSVRYIDNQQ